MHPPVGAARWAAIRALCEGAAPTFPLVARATKLNPATIRERASVDGWDKPNFQSSVARRVWSTRAAVARAATGEGISLAPPADWVEAATPRERLSRIGAFLGRQVEEMVAAAEANGGYLDKGRIDALASMVRMVEKTGTLAPERAVEEQIDDDAELAEKLRLVDERIIELAEAHARRLVGRPDWPPVG